MENPEQGIRKSSKKENLKIILQWIGMNFLGWSVAIFLWDKIYSPLYLLGLWLGIAQAIYLRKWNIPFLRWVVSTFVGLFLPIIIYQDLFYYAGNAWMMILFTLLFILIASSFLGWLQYFVIDEYFDRGKRWVWNTQLGHFLWLIAYMVEMFLLMEFFKDSPAYGTGPFDGVMSYLMVLITPLIAFVPAIFTGLFLARNRKGEVEVLDVISAPEDLE
jgi:hypothetical protein